ncbi:MAG: radical SAM protein [Cenarchaeum symbiont of Oopsacas minuta]|nr:radical SAM protein [Cenarchaeum symbiont of Oopsacas minuta]
MFRGDKSKVINRAERYYVLAQVWQTISSSEIGDILERSLAGTRLTKDDCIRMLESPDVHLMGMVAGYLTRKIYGKKASFVNNIILNYTNVCITDCKFCAFYRSPNDKQAYTLTLEQIESRVKTAYDMFGIRQALIQGGHNPDLSLEYYESAFSMIRSKFPMVGIHALSASEIDIIAKVERSSTREILSRLKDAGLQSVPGAGAEILVDSVKDVISPKKIKSADWIRIMQEAHEIGLPSSATMMYGHVESVSDIATHFELVSSLQQKTGGFMAFIPWSFESNNTEMQDDPGLNYKTGGINLLRMIAISRLYFYGLIEHIQSSWLTNGVGMAQIALQHGADDFGGTLIGEEVVSCTGARSTELTDKRIVKSIRQMGYKVLERDNFYKTIRER